MACEKLDKTSALMMMILQTMVIPEEREGRMEDDLDLARGEGQVKETSSRKGGLKQKEKETQRVGKSRQ
jgi:hypothetical protein